MTKRPNPSLDKDSNRKRVYKKFFLFLLLNRRLLYKLQSIALSCYEVGVRARWGGGGFLYKDTGLFGEILVSQSPQTKSSGLFFLLKVPEVLIQSGESHVK